VTSTVALDAADLRRKDGSATQVWQRVDVIPAGIALGALCLYVTVGLLRYLTYHSPAFDLGFFEQVTERTAAGHPFADSFNPWLFLGQHWEPVLAVPAMFDRLLTSTPIWLIVMQAAALAAAPIMAWRLAHAWLGGRGPATVAAVVTALSPLIAGGAAFDYHSEALTPALALAALDGAARGRTWRFVVPVLGLTLVKEDAFLVAAGVGWIVWCVHRRRLALWVTGGALAGFALLVGVVMQALRGGDPGDLSWRYMYLGGSSPLQWIAGAVSHPLRPLQHLAGTGARSGMLRAFAPLGFVPLLAGFPLLGTLPVLALALLSVQARQSSLELQYGLEAFPLLLACALLGWRRMRTWKRSPAPGLLLVGCTVIAYATTATLPGGARFDASATAGLERRAGVETVLSSIPADASVSATEGLVAHLANRAEIHVFPDGAQAEYVITDEVPGQSRSANDAGYRRALAGLPAHGYHVVASMNGVTVWKR
jgi:hypothetical protein